MPIERLTTTRKGHRRGAIISLHRFFDFLFGKSPKRNNGDALPKIKAQLSNAEYHLTAGQMVRIIEAGRGFRDRVLLQMLAETGMRRAEVASLNIEDIQWRECLLVVRQGKGNKLRLVPMTRSLSTNLAQLVGSQQAGPVFKSRRGIQLSLRQVNRIVADAGKQARVNNPNPKYKNITPHLFRHSFARLWKERGGDIEALSKIMGHSSVRTTWDLYGKSSLSDIQRQYAEIMRKSSP